MTGRTYQVFISSVQKEFERERRALKDFILGDALLRLFFADVFLFEDLPAQGRRADDIYLGEAGSRDIYIGLFGDEYGYEDEEGVSPTEREFDRATATGKTRLIYVKGRNDRRRHTKMKMLIRKASQQLSRRRFEDIPELTAEVYASLVEFLKEARILSVTPFDTTACHNANLRHLSREQVTWFLKTARQERQFALEVDAATRDLLEHLNLLEAGKPTNAGVLLFAANPQRFHPTAETKCLHFHGTEVRKPIPSYQIFKGALFQQIDQAVDFVLAKLARAVGTRSDGAAVPVNYEIPREAVAEAVVNAIAHRDYTSSATVQVMVFADRVEVWNPGQLPPELTPSQLRVPHPSIPRNPLIAEALFLAHYIEKAGTGTLDIIARCREAGLPEPDFEQRGQHFVTTLWRDWLTDEVLVAFHLNDRQRMGIVHVKTQDRITNREYQALTGTSRKTASRDLEDLVRKGLFQRLGEKRGTHYVLSRKMDQK